MPAGSAVAVSSTVSGMGGVHHTCRPTGQPTGICLAGTSGRCPEATRPQDTEHGTRSRIGTNVTPASTARDSSTWKKPEEASSGIGLGVLPEGPCRTSQGPSACVPVDSYREAGTCRTSRLRLLPAETVEFSVSCASEESVPFVRRKSENRPLGVPAVAYADPAIGQARHLDTVTVGET
jgi:hypothetical protein